MHKKCALDELGSGGLSHDFAGLVQNPVTAKNQARVAARNITVVKLN